jgi:hypothetical protein
MQLTCAPFEYILLTDNSILIESVILIEDHILERILSTLPIQLSKILLLRAVSVSRLTDTQIQNSQLTCPRPRHQISSTARAGLHPGQLSCQGEFSIQASLNHCH